MQQQRIYAVTTKADGSARLVLAQNPAQAMRHVANDLFEVKAASAATVARLMSKGTQLEDTSATDEPEADNVVPMSQAA